VVGIQLLSLGLVGEMITSHHAEKEERRDTSRHVRNVLG
jgi:hypothetical protein